MERGISITSKRNVEAAGPVDPPKPVEAGLVQVDESRGALGGGEARRVERAHALEVAALVDVVGERVEHRVDVVAHLLPAMDQLSVRVAQHSATRSGGEEERSAADEGLVVAPQPRGNMLEQLGEQRGLSAG